MLVQKDSRRWMMDFQNYLLLQVTVLVNGELKGVHLALSLYATFSVCLSNGDLNKLFSINFFCALKSLLSWVFECFFYQEVISRLFSHKLQIAQIFCPSFQTKETPSNSSQPHFKFSKHNLFAFLISFSYLTSVGSLLVILFFMVTIANMVGL